jgi:hypothetical protein
VELRGKDGHKSPRVNGERVYYERGLDGYRCGYAINEGDRYTSLGLIKTPASN